MKYKMKISLNIIEHLGINLYSNLPAVLSEIVANSWDADATEVQMNIEGTTKIEIIDNGIGMSEEDINEKFLLVGYKKRERGFVQTLKGRKVMGRKGIGKLSLFSIANKITIISKKENEEINAFVMNVNDIREAANQEKDYEPIVLKSNELPKQLEHNGTIIILEELKRERIQEHNIKTNLARRFSVIGGQNNFKVFVNNEEIGVEDRNYFKKLDYIWYFGEESKFFLDLCSANIESTQLEESFDNYVVSGWIGSAKESNSLQEGINNLNKISILIRGKLAQEDILSEFRIGGLYTKFLIGEINADFLDTDDSEDITTSNRQKIREDDPRYIALKDFIKRQLNIVGEQRQKFKEKQGKEEILKNAIVKEWYNSLEKAIQKRADKLFGRINQISSNESDKKTLIKHGVLAFENMKMRYALDSLDRVNDDNLGEFLEIFDNYKDIEASAYYDITKGRLEIIKSLDDKLKANELEKVLQEHIFNNLWLLDPSWERGTENAQMEEVVQFIAGEESEEIKKGRIDIHYRQAANKHIIIELKRASVTPEFSQITKQLNKYKKALKDKLKQISKEHDEIECIFICENLPSSWTDNDTRKEQQESLKALNIRVLTYSKLIQQSLNAYQEYINKDQENGRILTILKEIDKMDNE